MESNKRNIRLPRLRVTALHAEGVVVSFDEPKWIGERYIACIVPSPGVFLWGRFTDVDLHGKRARFVFDKKEDVSLLQAGIDYEYLDGYWGERAKLVYDRSRIWSRTEFKPLDAVEFSVGGKRIRGKWGQEPMADAESVHRVEGGWDHEHCSICWETIGPYEDEENTGYRDQDGKWVCERCYDSFVVSKKLDFIEEPQQPAPPDRQ
jgi:hypothetical protein